jgi:hypothetical protein
MRKEEELELDWCASRWDSTLSSKSCSNEDTLLSSFTSTKPLRTACLMPPEAAQRPGTACLMPPLPAQMQAKTHGSWLQALFNPCSTEHTEKRDDTERRDDTSHASTYTKSEDRDFKSRFEYV